MNINEGLKAGDLEGVVNKRFSVDQFKSKMGDDKNIMVLAFTVDGMAPAKDLERFAETGYKSILDADATPGTLEDGKHKVFVEFARESSVVKNIIAFLEDKKTYKHRRFRVHIPQGHRLYYGFNRSTGGLHPDHTRSIRTESQ